MEAASSSWRGAGGGACALGPGFDARGLGAGATSHSPSDTISMATWRHCESDNGKGERSTRQWSRDHFLTLVVASWYFSTSQWKTIRAKTLAIQTPGGQIQHPKAVRLCTTLTQRQQENGRAKISSCGARVTAALRRFEWCVPGNKSLGARALAPVVTARPCVCRKLMPPAAESAIGLRS